MQDRRQMALKQNIEDAQYVLVGIGAEFAQRLEPMEQDAFYASLADQARSDAFEGQLRQYLQFHYLKRHPDKRILDAYGQLASLLEGKDYFIVSLCTDDLIYETELDPSRIVTPCGGWRAMQCGRECVTDQEPLVTDENVMRELLSSIDECDGELDAIDFPVCAECSAPLWFNQISAPEYREEGYLPQWQKYTRWLMGTLNRKLCILELGVGMQFLQIIRFPFEKVAYVNQKAYFYRVHSRLYQLTEELKGKGVSVPQNPVDFLLSMGEEKKDDGDH